MQRSVMTDPAMPTDEQLIALADSQSFRRAQSYVRSGAVEITARSAQQVEALVTGRDDYTVRLLLGVEVARSWCSCPVGAFCKHLIATALVVRAEKPGLEAEELPSAKEEPSNLRAFLETQSVSRLAGWLEELADTDVAVERRLRLYQAQNSPAQLRTALGRLLRAPRFLDYRASNRFGRELDTVVDLLAEFSKADPHRAPGLYEYAITRLLKLYEQSDDSGGAIGLRIGELVECFIKLLEQSPTSDRASMFLRFQRLDQWTFFSTKAIWALLDEQSRAEYASAVEADYRAIAPSSVTGDGRFRRENFGPIHRMEDLAEVRGDVDLLIAVLARDLSSGHTYGRIVSLLETAGRDREAMQWAERGLKAQPQWPGSRALLARHYSRAGLLDEAVKLCWEDFQQRPEISTWQSFKEAAGTAWRDYRTRALKEISRRERRTPDGRADVSLRVRLLVADGDLPGALALAVEGAVAPGILEDLARRAAPSHAAQAAEFLRRAVDATLVQCQPRSYAHLAHEIDQVTRLAPGPRSEQWVGEIRERFKARRKFIAALDAAMTVKSQ